MLSSAVLCRLHGDPNRQFNVSKSSDKSVLIFWLVNFKLVLLRADMTVTHWIGGLWRQLVFVLWCNLQATHISSPLPAAAKPPLTHELFPLQATGGLPVQLFQTYLLLILHPTWGLTSPCALTFVLDNFQQLPFTFFLSFSHIIQPHCRLENKFPAAETNTNTGTALSTRPAVGLNEVHSSL